MASLRVELRESPAELPKGGFTFDLCQRNAFLEKNGNTLPKAFSTGTTIAGAIFKDGVVLGADTRATEGPIVCDKNCEKIHYIADNIYCCGAGTAADTEKTTEMISSRLELHRLATEREPRVITALTMLKKMLFRYQGHVSAALILGGVDATGPSLHTIYPHGSTDQLPFVTMGSGSLAAMAVFESGYEADMEEEACKKLVHQAICAGIFNDLGSGSNVDLVVIRKGEIEVLRNFDKANPRQFRKPSGYGIVRGTTEVLKQKVETIKRNIVVTDVAEGAMEV
eukprot:TRINITY_DN1880_c0_g2_i3.p1 TRINITY_DN1880_c0_g2~~TRINITY_DN1880_c0_g2_i3.p1  ORF type:complete len:294 (+),score=88.28 TRINITY_DN1880_c0_g2_i3:39-884(+)